VEFAAGEDWRLEKVLSDYERLHIKRSLEKSEGDKKLASEMLGLSLSTLYRKIEKWQLVEEN
jgi:transcriptional regulator with PAS, ATPase and Fis domain